MQRTSLPYNVGHEHSLITLDERIRKDHHGGHVVAIHGLPSSGKSTVALHVEKLLWEIGIHCIIADSAFLRLGICSGLGYRNEDREQYIRRTASFAAHCARYGTVVIVAIFNPFEEHWQSFRKILSEDLSLRPECEGLKNLHKVELSEFVLDAPIELCEARDPKGVWAQARAGELPPFFPGIDIEYEKPQLDDRYVVRMDASTRVSDAASAIFEVLNREIIQR